jgi:hypothetical protein
VEISHFATLTKLSKAPLIFLLSITVPVSACKILWVKALKASSPSPPAALNSALMSARLFPVLLRLLVKAVKFNLPVSTFTVCLKMLSNSLAL